MCLKSVYYLIAVTMLAKSTAGMGVQKLFPDLKKQYVFILKSNISSGTLLPVENNSHWTLEGKLFLQVFNYTLIGCRLDDIKTSVFNKKQAYPSSLPEDAKELTNAWKIQYQPSGTVYSVYLPAGEPIWSSNIKRAISLSLQLQRPDGNNDLSFNTNEPCLHGICNVEYTSVDGKTIRKTHDIPTVEAGLGRYVWNSVPTDSCTDGRNIQSFIGSAERVYSLDESKGLMDLDLRSTLQYHTYNHLLAVTTEMSLNLDNKDMSLEPDQELNLVSMYPGYYPHFYKEPSNGRSFSTQEQLFNETKQLLLKISKGIDSENIVRNSSVIHNLELIELHKIMSKLDYAWLTTLYEELAVGTSYDVETCRNIYLEVLPFVKSSACAMFVKYLVVEQKQQIEDSTLLSLVRKLPFNVANYSQELLDQMESFTKLGPDFPQDIKHACILSFATLAYHTYRNGGCTADYFENIVVKYFRMYTDCPQYLDRMIWLQGLSNLQVGSVYSYLAPKIISSATNRHERFFGLLATLQTAAVDPIVGTVLSWPILTNEKEHIQLRVAALLQILASDQSPGRLLALHEYISKGNDNQLKRFWYTTVKSLEKSTYSCYEPIAQYTSYVSKLVRSPDNRFWATGNYILDSSDDERNSAALVQLISIGDPLTGLPEVVHINVRTSQIGLVTTNIAVLIKAEGVSLSLFKRLNKVDSESIRVERLVELLKDMKVQIVDPEKVHIEIVAKIHDKAIYATHLKQTRFDSWNGNDLAQSIQDFLQFGSHINQQTVLYPLQVDMNLATELGTPVTLQTTFSSFSSIRGNLSAPYTTHALTWKNDVHFRHQATVVTSLSTAGPILPSDHEVRIQQSMVAHLPLKFDVSLSPATRSFQLKWPNPGSQNGGIAMHSRAQVVLRTPKIQDICTVDTGDHKYSVDESGIFFDCDRPMTGMELIEKLLDSNKSKFDFLTSIRPPLVLLHGLFLVSVPPSGSCGLILPPIRPLQETGDNVLEVNVEVENLDFTMEENMKMKILHSVLFRENGEDGVVYFNVTGISKIDASAGRSMFSLSLSGEQPTVLLSRIKWKICLQELDTSQESSDQDLSSYPSAYGGNLTLAFGTGDIPEECPTNGSTFSIEYKGKPANMYTNNGVERLLEFKITGERLPKLDVLSETGIGAHTTFGQLLRKLDKDPLDLNAVVKARNGVASLTIDNGPELQFKSDHFNWLLDNWSNMQILKKFGIYRECRLEVSTVYTLTGSVEQLKPLQNGESLALADCSNTPRFALLRQIGGSYKFYTGGNYITFEHSPIGIATVKVNNNTIDYHNGYSYPVNESVYDFKITLAGEAVKVYSRISGIIMYYKTSETIILVPDLYLSVSCGSCMS